MPVAPMRLEVGHDLLAGAHRHGALHDEQALPAARRDLATARCTRDRSASPDGDGGVSTAMNRMLQRSSRSSYDVVNESRAALSSMSFSSPGS